MTQPTTAARRAAETISEGVFKASYVAEMAGIIDAEFAGVVDALRWIVDRLDRGGKAASSDATAQARAALAKMEPDCVCVTTPNSNADCPIPGAIN